MLFSLVGDGLVHVRRADDLLLLERVSHLGASIDARDDGPDAERDEDDAGDEAAVFHEGLHLELLGVVGGSESGRRL